MILRIARFVISEFRATIQRPVRLLRVLHPTDAWQRATFRWLVAGTRDRWDSGGTDRVQTRRLENYKQYAQLQASKLSLVDLRRHEAVFSERLRERLIDIPHVERGRTVLCLGARLGAEVPAFLDLGCFAVGVDLNPGEDNKYVLSGDFHELQWPGHCVDIVYTNSLDHAFDLDRVTSEIRRVLREGGHLILEADPGVAEEDGVAADTWATLRWQRVDDLIEELQKRGLEPVSRRRFEYPRLGYQVVFEAKR